MQVFILLIQIVLDFIEKDKPMDMPELLTLALEKICKCPIHEYWLDVGQPETLSKAKEILGQRNKEEI